MAGSVRDYAILWVGAGKPGSGAGGTALGGNALLSTAQHKLDGIEHLGPDDTTRLDASIDVHGLLPKLSGSAADRLDGLGAFRPLPADEVTYDDTLTAFGVAQVQAAIEAVAGLSAAGSLPWFNVKTDGTCVGDGVTDDTVALQAAIDAATASGTQSATLYFPPGNYLIGGALQDTGARNAQILLPNVSTASDQITIRFLGAARPPLAVHGPIPSADNYSMLTSMLSGASGTAAVISGGNGGYPLQNNVQVVIEDLVCFAPSNPTMTWWNLSCTQGGRTTGLYVSTTTDWVGTRVQPTHSNSYGIKLPGYGESNYTHVDGLIVCGFYTGYLQGELTIARGIGFAFCVVAVELGFTAGHGSMIISMHQTACTYGIKVTTATWCDILLYDAEHWTSPGWADTVYDVDDGSNLLHGSLRWFGVAIGGAPDHVFDINGGSNVTYSEIGANPAGLSFGTPALTLGTSNTAGSASTAVRTDATVAAFDATAPTTSAIGDAAATGSTGKAARRDHVHGREALSTATPLVESGAGAVGTGVKASREDHVHPAATASPSSGADDHIHVVSEAFTSDGVATSFLLANEAIPGTVAAYDVAGARKAVTLGGMNDQITFGASPGTGTCLVDYVPLQV